MRVLSFELYCFTRDFLYWMPKINSLTVTKPGQQLLPSVGMPPTLGIIIVVDVHVVAVVAIVLPSFIVSETKRFSV